MQISVVIPTCDRKKRLLALLENLDRLHYSIMEVIIVDSGNEKLALEEYSAFTRFPVYYLDSERSVCIQRNIGIAKARSPWVFLCDDDIELPADYLDHLVNHINKNPTAGAVSGIWMELHNREWKATHPVTSNRDLLVKYIFHLSIWGEIKCKTNIFTHRIKKYYLKKGNHISKAGWPVNTDFSGEFVICPVYSLGASLVKKDWLLLSPFDELLDAHGIGDNYGVVVDFPGTGVHVINSTFVKHHLEEKNRLQKAVQYYRRALALDYFVRVKKNLKAVKRRSLAWSLFGNLAGFILSGNGTMIKPGLKSFWKVVFGKNPYYAAKMKGKKVVEPRL